jgi:DNA polymerase I-like protein with 3'-5' exonuclease and polymerase domains
MSFYGDQYKAVREACFRLLCHGVRFDTEEAKRKATELTTRKDAIKGELDTFTGGFKLYAESRHRSPALLKLMEKKRQLKEMKDALPKSDKDGRKALLAAIKAAAEESKELKALGKDVVVERGVGLSDQKIAGYLYGTLGLPAHRKRRKDTGKLTITVDDITLKKVYMAAPQYTDLIKLILEHRKCTKLLGYLDESHVDPDGRLRSLYKPFGTQTGRLSSAENPTGTGTNLQNFDRTLKYLLIPDAG